MVNQNNYILNLNRDINNKISRSINEIELEQESAMHQLIDRHFMAYLMREHWLLETRNIQLRNVTSTVILSNKLR